ncbi:MAG: hypothetical protein ACYDC2_01970 [Solirubrobacteraceae bacterium]
MQIEDDGSLDVRATGIVGFNGALVAATIAAKSLLGHYWYTPFFGLGLSTLILLASLFGDLDRRLSKLEKGRGGRVSTWGSKPRPTTKRSEAGKRPKVVSACWAIWPRRFRPMRAV